MPNSVVERIKAAKNFKSLVNVFESREFTASNPKTIRWQKRALKAKLKTLRVKSTVPRCLVPTYF